MPLHLIEGHLQTGALKQLTLEDSTILPGSIPIYAVHQRSRPLGTAARSLLHDLQKLAK